MNSLPNISFPYRWNSVAAENCSAELSEERVSYSGVEEIWMVGWMCVLEYAVLWLRDKPLPPPHENLLSMTHGIFNQLIKMWVRSVEFLAYVWLWKRYALFPVLFTDSLFSYLGTILLIDFCYYWFHRMSHEVTLFWAIHQVHHSSVEVTIPVGLRHSPIQNLFSWIFYCPLAIIGLPASHLVVHLQLNLLYQTWIHTETVEKLGPLEWIFNTPSHHRIHHGILKHAIDKNFGGIFIIWDYLFRTFEREQTREGMIYGIIYQPEKWNIAYQQVFYLKRIIAKAKSMTNWSDFFYTFWKGPSWQPGSSRTGRELEVTYDHLSNQIRQRAHTSIFIDSYICLHLVASLCLLSKMTDNLGLNIFSFGAYSILILAALTNVGIIYEGNPIAIQIELFRCFGGFVSCMMFPITNGIIHSFVVCLFGLSWIFWIWAKLSKKFDTSKEIKENGKIE